MNLIFCYFFVSLVLILNVTSEDLDTNKYTNLRSVGSINPFFWRIFASIQKLWLNSNTRRKSAIITEANVQEKFADDICFPCNTLLGRSLKPPSSVHKLRPGDIDVIGAIGDSLTTASGALSTKLGHMFTENRGLAWNIGGQWTWRNATTLPNILKEFNPNLIGYSLNDSFTYSPGVEFNTAEIGAVTFDLPGMAKALVERIKKDSRVNFKKDWKMITIAIGANDICSYVCSLRNPEVLPEMHRTYLLDTLRYFKENLPRTFVNVVSKPKIRVLLDFSKKTSYCKLLQLGICSCFTGLFFNATDETRALFEKIEDKYIKVEEELARLPEFRGLKEFAVVYQPWTVNVTLDVDDRGEDRALLAYDCFHVSQKGHSYGGISVWNNLLEPDKFKTNTWKSPHTRFLCPTFSHPYFYTYDNENHFVSKNSTIDK